MVQSMMLRERELSNVTRMAGEKSEFSGRKFAFCFLIISICSLIQVCVKIGLKE